VCVDDEVADSELICVGVSVVGWVDVDGEFVDVEVGDSELTCVTI
jgi:hypothetical protein